MTRGGLLYRPSNEGTRCPCCDSGKIRHLEATHQKKMPNADERVAFVSGCVRCGAAFINPRPQSDKLDAYYAPDGGWASQRRLADQIGNPEFRAHKSQRYAEMLSRLSEIGVDLSPFGSGEALDFGCGAGFFMDQLAMLGWHTSGIDPASATIIKAHRMLDAIPDTPTFSLISALHVFEHIDGHLDLLRKFRQSLVENGMLLIAVPSFHELPQHKRKNYCINYSHHVVALTDRAIATCSPWRGLNSSAERRTPGLTAIFSSRAWASRLPCATRYRRPSWRLKVRRPATFGATGCGVCCHFAIAPGE
jgi:SAM-dependent methyltransferase